MMDALTQDLARRDHSLPLFVKLGYGAAEGGGSLLNTVFLLFYLYFLTDVVGLEPFIAGAIMMIGTLWDATLAPIVGVWSDRFKSRFGRRRPFFLGAAIPYGVVAYLLFADFGLSGHWQVAYYFAVTLLYFTCFSITDVPHVSLAAEMTSDYEERVSLFSYRAGWSQLASLVGASSVLMIASSLADYSGGNIATGWSLTGALYGMIVTVLILYTWRTTRGYESQAQSPAIEKDIWRDIKLIFHNRVFVYTVGLGTCASVSTIISSSFVVYFMTYGLGFDESQSSIAFLILFASGLIWIPIVNYLVHKSEKRLVFVGMLLLNGTVGLLVPLLINPQHTYWFYGAACLLAAGPVAVVLLAMSMIPDVVEVDELKTGGRQEGLYYGVSALVSKVAGAVTLGVSGILLSFIGYQAGAEQSPETIERLKWLVALGPLPFILMSVWFCLRLPLTRKIYENILTAKANRKAGKPWDHSVLEGLWRE
jgi:sugar (glycoside-pentoside-hexuronide) transporter